MHAPVVSGVFTNWWDELTDFDLESQTAMVQSADPFRATRYPGSWETKIAVLFTYERMIKIEGRVVHGMEEQWRIGYLIS
jgi:hypothetical protein